MRPPRYNVVRLDGMDVALDLVGDAYIALPDQWAPSCRGDASAVAARLGTKPSEVNLTPMAGIILPAPRRDLGAWDEDWAADAPRMADWFALAAVLPDAVADIWYRPPIRWLANPQIAEETAGVRAAARRFRRMRLMVPGLGRCLPHALTLRAYLRRRGHPSTLVVGVRANPFEAHCWLQAADLVLTDDLERLAGYSAIAAG